MVPNLLFSVLGPVRVWQREREVKCGQPRQTAVLASLLLRHGAPVSQSTLADDVWGDAAPTSAMGSIRTYIYRIRRALEADGEHLIRLVPGGYTLHFESHALDLNRFRQLAARARGDYAAGRLAEAADGYADCLAHWTGPALAGVPGPFAEAQRAHLADLRLATVEERLACEVDRGRFAESAAELSALVSEHPLRERLCELYMAALYGLGRQSEALTAFYDTSHVLNERLGISPSRSLRQVHQLILTNALPLPPSSTGPGRSAWQPPATLAAPAQLPAGLPHFVGREAETAQVERLGTPGPSSSSMTTCVIGGLAGVGKTAFAVHLARRVAERYPDGQLFADLGGFSSSNTPRAPAEVLSDFLQSLGIPAGAQPAGTAARALLFRGLLADRRMVVVLDNARDSDHVRDLLPGSNGSMAIVTSRNQLHGLLAWQQAVPVLLEPFDYDAGREFLAQRLGHSRVAAEPAAVHAIIRLCEGLPLALSNVGARAAYRPTASMASIVAGILNEQSHLDAFAGQSDPGLDLRTVLSWSYRVLDPDCARLFRSLSLCPGTEFTGHTAAAVTGLSPRKTSLLLERLTHSHLLTEQDPGRYRWHALVRAYAAELFEAADGEAVRRLSRERLAGSHAGTNSKSGGGESGGPSRLQTFLARSHGGLTAHVPCDVPLA